MKLEHETEIQGYESAQNDYSSEQLEGLTVLHDFADIEEGKDIILTIKDKNVLDDGDNDELISTVLAEKARLKDNLENKFKKWKYDPYAEESSYIGREKPILAKYDDEIKKTFTIGKEPGALVHKRRKSIHPSD